MGNGKRKTEKRVLRSGCLTFYVLRFTSSLDQIPTVRCGVIRFDQHVERQSYVSRRANLDPVRARLETQALEHAVEIVHDADVIPIDVDRRVDRFDLQPQRAIVIIVESAGRAVRRVPPEPRIVRAVVAAVAVPGIEAAIAATDANAATVMV